MATDNAQQYFIRESDFELALTNLLQEHGWTHEVIVQPSEDDLVQNWANILYANTVTLTVWAIDGVYASDKADWTSEGLMGKKLSEYQDIKRCLESFEKIVSENVAKYKAKKA